MTSTPTNSEKKAPDRTAGGETLANQVGGEDSRQPACQRGLNGSEPYRRPCHAVTPGARG